MKPLAMNLTLKVPISLGVKQKELLNAILFVVNSRIIIFNY